MRIKYFFIGLLLLLSLANLPKPVSAVGFSPSDLITALNTLRAARRLSLAPARDRHAACVPCRWYDASGAARGLPAYQVDAELMAYAQQHAEYQANINTSTHQHSYGAPLAGAAAIQSASTPQPVAALVTNTPAADGSIVHIVGYGQSLWEIAISYGLTIDQIRGLNGLSGDTTAIYAGQRLVLRLPVSATPTILLTPTITETPTPSRTPSPSPTRLPPKTTLTPTASPEPERQSFNLALLFRDTKTLGILLIISAGIGLVVVLYFGFRK